MEKKKWLWKRRSSDRSPGESESPGSSSSQSERYSDEQGASRESPKDIAQSPEITSEPSRTDDEVQDTVKSLTEKLSAALVNVSAKENLAKQHAKVAEEAVAGWEKAENEVVLLNQQLEAAVQQNTSMEVRINHLDGALKECVRQLRQAKDEQEKMISDAIAETGRNCESTKAELEKRILELQAEAEAARAENSASIDPKFLLIVDRLEKENSLLKQELMSKCRELETIKVERDLSTETAETASKLQLESIKKVAKLEAECRRLHSAARKSTPVNNPKAVSASYFYAESLTDSHSDSGERLQALDVEPSCSDSWASALIAELDQFRSDKLLPKTLRTGSFEIDMMDDFLEMERIAALPDTKSNTPLTASESASGESICMDNPLRTEVDSMIERIAELEKKLEKIEAEKLELEGLLDEKQGSLEAAQHRIAEAETKLEEVQKDLVSANEAKESLEVQLVGLEAETRTMSANINSVKVEIEKERSVSAELTVRCRELENELRRTVQECETQQNTNSDGVKVKQEDLAVAADKLAECQKTIASLGMQLKSLATLEDFLVDTSKIPGFSKGSLVISGNGHDIGKLSSNMFSEMDPSKTSRDSISHLEKGNSDESTSPPSLATLSSNLTNATKSRNGFGKFFSRSKAVIEHDNHHE